MRISLVTETYPPEINGVAMTLSQLVAGLRKRGHGVQVVRPRQASEKESDSAEPDILRVSGFPIPRYPDLRFGLPCRNRLIHAWSLKRPDIVHIATEGPLGLSAIRAARRLGIPTTSTFHTNFHSYSKHYNATAVTGLVLWFLRWVHNQTRCTMAPTQELANELTESGFQNMDTFGRGVDLSVFNPQARDFALRQEWQAGPNDPVFIHVSRLAAEKNYELLSQTYSKISDKYPNARFVVVGGGPMDAQLKRMLPFAYFTGPIPLESRPALARLYASADIFLYPSETETYGNVTTEAMACGNAVLAYDYAAAALHIEHGANGLVVRMGDGSAFVEQSLALVADPALRRRLGAAAAAYSPAFDWQPVVAKFESILQRECGLS